MTERASLLLEIAREFLSLNPAGRRIIAIDGVDGAGKTSFADALASVLRAQGENVVRASIDGFHRPRAERYARGRDSAEGYYRDSFDLVAVRERLIDPFLAGASEVTTAAFDHEHDEPVDERVSGIPSGAILVFDGIFVHRPELRRLWHSSIWLDVNDAVREQRLIARDGEGSLSTRYSEGQQLYVHEANPRRTADIVIDNNNHDRPQRLFVDFC